MLSEKGGDLSIYNEILRDDQVKSTFQQRRLAVISAAVTVEPGGPASADKNAADHLREQIERLDWDSITDHMLYGVFYGYAVAEAVYEVIEGKVALTGIRVRDRARFGFGLSGSLYLKDDKGQYQVMPERKFWTLSTGATHTDQPYGIGLGHYLYWPVFFKRNGVKFWMNFLDKFATPTAIGRMPRGQFDDKKLRQDALDSLEAIHGNTCIVVPEDVQTELIEATRSGTGDYGTLVEHMNRAISKVVLSQTMTTDDGSSRAQAQVHAGVRDDVIQADNALVSESFTNTLARWITEWNFPGAAIPIVSRETEPPEDLQKRAERDQKIYAIGFEPTEDYIREIYGAGWVKRQPGVQRIEPQFAELVGLTADKNRNRENQQALVEAARRFSQEEENVMSGRVLEILDYLDESQDLETFKAHLTELLGEAPNPKAIDSLQRSGMVARLMGWLRGQR